MESCGNTGEIRVEDLNPTFLFTWTGTRKSGKDEDYHSHDIVEMAFVLSGVGRYRVDGEVFSIQEGFPDL